MRQVEVSRTIVFDDPRRARGFFESLVQDNVGIGRPAEVSAVFGRQVRKTTKEPFRTRIFSPGTEVKMDFSYNRSRVKQYLKQGRALRIETVINKPSDLGILARIERLPELAYRPGVTAMPSEPLAVATEADDIGVSLPVVGLMLYCQIEPTAT
jgi:hypothetical protein